MARGMGGDDGPSLWMFVAVILVWGSIKQFFTDAKEKASDVLSTNYANPTQSETTKDIKNMETAVKRTPVTWSKLRPKATYERIAMQHRQLMDTGWNVDEDKLFEQVQNLSADELKAVYYCFGVPDRTNGLIALWTGDLFMWYEKTLDDWSVSGPSELDRMKGIWAKTRMW